MTFKHNKDNNKCKIATLGVPGAFGGGREGVQQAEYQAGSDRNRAMMQAGLLQQGYGNAQNAAQQAFQNQQAMQQANLGLGQAGQNQLAGFGVGQAQLIGQRTNEFI